MPSKIVWNEAFSVGVPLLDQQHQQQLALLQKAADCMEDDSPSNRDVFRSLLNDAFFYTSAHFLAEETLLKQCKYPNLEAHRAEHVVFLAQIAQLNFSACRGAVCKVELYDTLFRLFNHDMLESDRQYIPYLTPSQLATNSDA